MTEKTEAFDLAAVTIPKGLRLRQHERVRIAQKMAHDRREKQQQDDAKRQDVALDLHKRLMAFLWGAPSFEEAVRLTRRLSPALTFSPQYIAAQVAHWVERDGNRKLKWLNTSFQLGFHNGALSAEVDGEPALFWAPFNRSYNTLIPHFQKEYVESCVGDNEDWIQKVLKAGNFNGFLLMPDDQLAKDLAAWLTFDIRLNRATDDLCTKIRANLGAIKSVEQLRTMLPEAFEIHYALYPDRYVADTSVPALRGAEASAASIKAMMDEFPDLEAA